MLVMATQTIWKGVIELGKLSVPVGLHSAVQDHDLHFNLLHDADQQRVEQRLVHGETGKPVAKSEIRRAYEAGPGSAVVIGNDELAQLAPAPSRSIEVLRCVPLDAIAPRWFERPYYLTPDRSSEAYAALAQELARAKRQGVARWVMRKHHYVGALRPRGDRLVLFALRFSDEVLDAPHLASADKPTSDPRERGMAENLVEALSGEFDPAAFHDSYRARVLDFIEAKAKHRVVHLKAWKHKRGNAGDLEHALQASLDALKKPRTKRKAAAHG